MSGPRAPQRLRHEPQCTPLKFEEPLTVPEFTQPGLTYSPGR
jgi:hypothetical protein